VSVKQRFDDLYAEKADPWGYETSGYEHAKYQATVAALPRRYATALEVGCSIGVLSERLAAHADALLGVDVPEATFERRELPAEFPPGPFELIVCSEVLYYVGALDELLAAAQRELAPGGTLLAVHWLGMDATPAIHARLERRFGTPSFAAWTDDYALDRWEVPA
jgi:predicted TPR repeat methyltransferase